MTLIILRGNSGSGKTSTAKRLQRELGDGTMLVSQDVVRRDMLYTKDTASNPAIQLIYELCMYGNRAGYTVILEGILSTKKYGHMVQRLMADVDGSVHAYYFELPFEETVRRHHTKHNAHEFGEAEMRAWWKHKDYLNCPGEVVITADVTQEALVRQIIQTVQNDV